MVQVVYNCLRSHDYGFKKLYLWVKLKQLHSLLPANQEHCRLCVAWECTEASLLSFNFLFSYSPYFFLANELYSNAKMYPTTQALIAADTKPRTNEPIVLVRPSIKLISIPWNHVLAIAIDRFGASTKNNAHAI